MSGSSGCVLAGGLCLTADATFRPGQIVVQDGRIVGLLSPDTCAPEGLEVIDVSGCLVSPGMIDVMIHGMHDHAFASGDPSDVVAAARILAGTGVTGFLPALYALPLDEVEKRIASLRPALEHDTGGAVPLGIHMEGPFFSVPGAHRAEFLRTPDPKTLDHLLGVADGLVKMLTLAPEVAGGIAAIRQLCAHGVVVSIGHSAASVSVAEQAVAAGATAFTHIYDAMAPPPVTDPGVFPVGLTDAGLYWDELVCTIICDGVHVHPFQLRLLVKVKGVSGLVLITDAVRGAGLDGLAYKDSRDREIVSHLGQPMRDDEGGLCGSSLTLDRAVRNMVALAGVTPAQAITMATLNPARLLGIDARKGRITPGHDADLVVWTPELTVRQTLIAGRFV